MYKEISDDILKGRAAIYEYLFRAFYKVPDENFLKVTKNFNQVALSVANDSDSPFVKEGAGKINAFINSDLFKKDDCLLSLNAVFTSLFVIGTRISDRESRRREDKIGHNDVILSVSKYMADALITKPVAVNMPVDSFSMELFYMFKTAWPFKREQAAFMDEHLIAWSGEYLKEVAEKAEKNEYGAFYSGLAYFCYGFLFDDHAWLKQFL